MYSPKTNQRLLTQLHHPSGQSWKRSIKTLVDKNAVLNFIFQREMSLTCFARHTSSSPGTARRNFQSNDNKYWFETNVQRGFKQISMVREGNCEQGLYQVLLQNNNHTRNLLHPPWKRKIGWKSGSFRPPYIRIQLWVLFLVLCTNNCQDHPHLVRWPEVWWHGLICGRYIRELPCCQSGCATTWRSNRQLRSMESSPFHKLLHSLNNDICIYRSWFNRIVTSPAEGYGSPSSSFILHSPQLLFTANCSCQFHHPTFLTSIDCEENCKSEEYQDCNCEQASFHGFLCSSGSKL